MTQQTATISAHPFSPRQPVTITCMRDTAVVMTLKATSRRDAEILQSMWEGGATQAAMAALMRNLGLKF